MPVSKVRWKAYLRWMPAFLVCLLLAIPPVMAWIDRSWSLLLLVPAAYVVWRLRHLLRIQAGWFGIATAALLVSDTASALILHTPYLIPDSQPGPGTVGFLVNFVLPWGTSVLWFGVVTLFYSLKRSNPGFTHFWAMVLIAEYVVIRRWNVWVSYLHDGPAPDFYNGPVHHFIWESVVLAGLLLAAQVLPFVGNIKKINHESSRSFRARRPPHSARPICRDAL